MSVALVWVVSPNTKVLNCFGVLESSSFVLGDPSWKMRAEIGRKQKWNSCSLSSTDVKYPSSSSGTKLPILSSMVANPAGISSEQKVYDVVLKQAALVEKQLRTGREAVDVKPDIILPGNLGLLSEAYDRCREVCAEYAKTFYLGWSCFSFFSLFVGILVFSLVHIIIYFSFAFLLFRNSAYDP